MVIVVVLPLSQLVVEQMDVIADAILIEQLIELLVVDAVRSLTGGFGNAIGVAIGAFIFGMTSLCIVYAGWDPNWFKAFLGVMLLLAVMVNLYVKRLSTMRKAGLT